MHTLKPVYMAVCGRLSLLGRKNRCKPEQTGNSSCMYASLS